MKGLYLLVFICIFSLTHSQEVNINCVLIAEVDNVDCDDNQSVFFISPPQELKLKYIQNREKYFKVVKSDFETFISELVDKRYPQYKLPDCITPTNKWNMIVEWKLNDTLDSIPLTKYISEKYKVGNQFFANYTMSSFSQDEIKNIDEIDPNKAIIDAYYSKAIQVYEEGKYDNTLAILDKAKVLLEDKKNLDVMLLEAKARLKIDKNISEVKTILNDFVKLAAKDKDDRLSSAADLLVSIETSEDYHPTGYKKEFLTTTKTNDDVITNVDQLDENGKVVYSKQYSSKRDNEIIREIDLRLNNEKIVKSYGSNYTVNKIEYFIDGFEYVIVDIKNRIVTYKNKGKLLQEITFKNDKADIKAFSNNKEVFAIQGVEIIDKYDIYLNDNLKALRTLPEMGLMKEVKEKLEKEEFVIYTFKEHSGLPDTKTYYKKTDKPKDNLIFDITTTSWVKPN